MIINVLQNAKNARAGGEFKGLIVACTVRYETLLRVFIFAIYMFFLQFPKQITPNVLKKKSVNHGAHNCLTPAYKGPFLIKHRFSCCKK